MQKWLMQLVWDGRMEKKGNNAKPKLLDRKQLKEISQAFQRRNKKSGEK